MTPFVDALLAAPIGTALLAELERAARPDLPPLWMMTEAEPGAVDRAADGVADRPLGLLLHDAVELVAGQIGPWNPGASRLAAHAYRNAPARRPIAEAIDEAFRAVLHAPVDLETQRWWHSNTPAESFRRMSEVPGAAYGAGQLPWHGLWTSTAPPVQVARAMVAAAEIWPEPVSEWRLPVLAGARVWTIHRPEDWAALVQDHPKEATPGQESWELPGRNQDAENLRPLLALEPQRAARDRIRRHLVPDWTSVAGAVDGVHLSWAGFLTSEGCITDLDGGDVAMLRYWTGERTQWLNDVLGEPEPLEPSPDLDGIDVRFDDARAAQDLEVLRVRLNRTR